MLDRDWLFFISIGLILTLGVASIPLTERYRGSSGEYHNASQIHSEADPISPEALSEAFGEAQAAYAEEHADHGEQRAERNLVAQEEMAKWAYGLFWVSLIGVGLLAGTFWEALRTAKAAEAAVAAANKTALAAIAATEITRKDFIATHRPRVVLRNFHISDEIISDSPIVEVVIANAGNTPAYIMKIGSDIPARMKENGNWLGLAARPKILPNPIRLDAGEEYEFSVVRNSVLEGEDWWKIDGGEAEFYLIGVIVYRDENQTTRKTGFLRVYDTERETFARPHEDEPEYNYCD
ncbi:MAG: hypothetical protein CVT72_01670 [Alphaproteobacteria bacterium HGW-Alphaproteobacteria-11]|nr:MAG: hypothetical protein CVT72_01670 [Alphaproteobacteria bacterium HGW-Alphaproteobacteria-11]